MKEIKRALISVYSKDGILEISKELLKNGVEILSTGGTSDFLSKNGIPVSKVEDITGYPSILGGRVKTLHPKVFGGILGRRDNEEDKNDFNKFSILPIDLVIVDLYPFEETVAKGADHQNIIEKIDIGGISLIRAAAKNYNDVVIIPSKESYGPFLQILKEKGANTELKEREFFAAKAFEVSSHYDTAIFDFFNQGFDIPVFDKSITEGRGLRYGENPHQKGMYFGPKNSLPEQIHGKEISHNNLLDIESAIELINDFKETTVAIIKHTNACGCASDPDLVKAWEKALAGDPVSAYGGILVTNKEIDKTAAEEMNKIFFEVMIAPSYTKEALDILEVKKNRVILVDRGIVLPKKKFRSLLNGVLEQERDNYVETPEDLKPVTTLKPKDEEIPDLIFANKLVKHSKSNAIVLAKGKQLLASGIGQTSRVDALRQAIQKAKSFNFDLQGAVMSSDAFFPFSDCVQIAAAEGIKAVIQPGGSIRDNESVDWCNNNNVAMVMTGIRHFKH
ncbi:MAG TPA: bifunctional phosphoribosylaminoimidazolecarboxamide formyltransferase/IMP cyclohydrolase [Candidatus Egerieousia sp.]|nr:bifunctional phosphoribosylaminoimidazolecarboxamide formyltransferase/IMP cyclohydrolase [Candidatus Egerieousia sp.]HPT05774.1 bifunctional phosphoribosylaminoimidazolecarboxamide formyltransferase/IMP cyclohydrolase [Candidatus Egerieousia sp.]